ncbi:putative cell wall-binding protein [Catenulispora sp. GP43]|uniref:cell wall-binding repeat-containing protein n=1 Tax=Catenulispora sp. GP43 TaxID=3156263 RepID=UPI0035123917
MTLSRSDLFADALGGSALSAHENGPLLITDTNSLPATTLAEIKRILPAGGTVYLLGGGKAISPAVASKLSGLGYHLQRIAGDNRYATSIAIADTIDPNPQTVLVATGGNIPDALSAGAVAGGHDHTVVVLTDDQVMPPATASYQVVHEG